MLLCATNPIRPGAICVVSAFEKKGYGDLRRSVGPEEQSQSEESLKCKVPSVKPENPMVWTSNLTLYTANLVHVLGTWHVASWFLAPKTRVVAGRNAWFLATAGHLWRCAPAARRLGIRLGRGVPFRRHPGAAGFEPSHIHGSQSGANPFAGKELCHIHPSDRASKTKPIFRRRRGVQHSTIPSFQDSRPGSILPNKANWAVVRRGDIEGSALRRHYKRPGKAVRRTHPTEEVECVKQSQLGPRPWGRWDPPFGGHPLSDSRGRLSYLGLRVHTRLLGMVPGRRLPGRRAGGRIPPVRKRPGRKKQVGGLLEVLP